MIAKLKEIVGTDEKVNAILDVVKEWLENNEVNRTEVRHTSVNEIIPKIYKMKNELLCKQFKEKDHF
jgi:hypothetical protein